MLVYLVYMTVREASDMKHDDDDDDSDDNDVIK